jgi:hypothetical protein
MNEMETLIKKIDSIFLGDPEYALLFYQAMWINPYVKDIIASPSRNRISTMYSFSQQDTIWVESTTEPKKRHNTVKGLLLEVDSIKPLIPPI